MSLKYEPGTLVLACLAAAEHWNYLENFNKGLS